MISLQFLLFVSLSLSYYKSFRKVILKRVLAIFAPPVGFEPTTLRLTGERSTIELQGIVETRLFYLNPENISLSLQSSYIKIKL